MNRFHLLAASSLLALASVAHADTVINLNATQTVDGNVFYKTLSSSNLAAGTYTATFVGSGYTATDGTTAAYTAFSKYSPAGGNWEDGVSIDTTGASFSAVNSGGSLENTYTATNSPLLGTNTHYTTATAALAAESGVSYTFTIGSTGGTTFYIQDQQYPTYPGYSDNTGGASLDIKAASAVTPEPSSLMLLGTGVIGMAGAVRRRFVKA